MYNIICILTTDAIILATVRNVCKAKRCTSCVYGDRTSREYKERIKCGVETLYIDLLRLRLFLQRARARKNLSRSSDCNAMFFREIKTKCALRRILFRIDLKKCEAAAQISYNNGGTNCEEKITNDA